MRRLAVVLVGVVLTASACGADDSPVIDVPPGGDRSTTTAMSSGFDTTSTTAVESADTGEPYATSAVSTPPRERGLLTAVRFASHDGFVRAVFEFRDALPGYSVDYTRRPIVQDGSGEEVPLAGDEALLVRFEPASGFDLETGEGKQTYVGPKRLSTTSDDVPEMVEVGDFEAVLQWAIGLDRKLPFRVSTLSSPARVVVDVQTTEAG